MRGRGPNDLDIPATPATFDAGTQTLTLPITTTNRALAKTVAIFDPLNIEWEVSVDGQNWCPAGSSENQVYVTLKDPVTTPKPGIAPPIVKFGNHPVYHSLLHLGCRAAHGVNALWDIEQKTLEAIWNNGFSANKTTPITRVNGTPLTYYKTTDHGALYTAELLQTGEGTCSAWTTLFLDVLRIQGLVYPDAHISLYPQQYPQEKFLIKNWLFGPYPGASQEPGYNYLNIAQPTLATFDASGVVYHWTFQEVADAPGIAGQNPVSIFANHQVIQINGDYYDPSYGTTYSSLADIDEHAIDGYCQAERVVAFNEIGANFDLNGDGIKQILPDIEHGYPIRKKNTGEYPQRVPFNY